MKEKIQELLDKLIGAHTTLDRQTIAAEIMTVLDRPLQYIEKAVEGRVHTFIKHFMTAQTAPDRETPKQEEAPPAPVVLHADAVVGGPGVQPTGFPEEPAEADQAKVSDDQPVEHGA